MTSPALSLLFSRQFAPLFGVQFLGALNDNLFRSAMIFLFTFELAEKVGIDAAILNNLALALFILPYFVASALAGQLADRFEKAGLVKWIKGLEVVLMLLGSLALLTDTIWLMFAVLFGLGLQSTFFGPIKYALLPELVPRERLLAGNALIEAGTFVAILLGLIIGGPVSLQPSGTVLISSLMVAVAAAGLLLTYALPATGQAAPGLIIRRNIVASTGEELANTWRSSTARVTITTISWIWMVGSLYLSQIPVIVARNLGADEASATFILVLFTLGIAGGALLTDRMLKGEISTRLAAPGMAGLAGLATLLWILLPDAAAADALTVGAALGIADFIATAEYWPLLAVFLLTAVAAAMVIVPLYTFLQDSSPREQRARRIAANNIVNSGFMAGGSVGAAAAIWLGASLEAVLLVVGLLGLLLIKPLRSLQHGAHSASLPAADHSD